MKPESQYQSYKVIYRAYSHKKKTQFQDVSMSDIKTIHTYFNYKEALEQYREYIKIIEIEYLEIDPRVDAKHNYVEVWGVELGDDMKEKRTPITSFSRNNYGR